MHHALTIAGSDPSGGAGIQADLKTFHQFGVYGSAAITLLTVQNTQGVSEVVAIEPELIVKQVQSLIEDTPPQAAKLGAFASINAFEEVLMLLKSAQIPVVVDPVFSPTHGKNFLDQKAIPRFRKLLSQIDLLTPNVQETSSLSEIGISNLRDLETAGHHLLKCGAKALLLKGGHLENLEATDILLDKGNTHFFKKSRIEKTNCHGTGCAYSAAITALLARNYSLKESIRLAKTWLHQAIQNASSFGKGNPPIDFFTSFPSTK